MKLPCVTKQRPGSANHDNGVKVDKGFDLRAGTNMLSPERPRRPLPRWHHPLSQLACRPLFGTTSSCAAPPPSPLIIPSSGAHGDATVRSLLSLPARPGPGVLAFGAMGANGGRAAPFLLPAAVCPCPGLVPFRSTLGDVTKS